MQKKHFREQRYFSVWLTYPKLQKYSYAAQVLGYRLTPCVFSYAGQIHHCSYFVLIIYKNQKKIQKKKWDRESERKKILSSTAMLHCYACYFLCSMLLLLLAGYGSEETKLKNWLSLPCIISHYLLLLEHRVGKKG